jgi:hypothetical protein
LALPSGVSMTKRRIGIAAIILLMLTVGIWVGLQRHRGQSGSAVRVPATAIPVTSLQVPAALAAIKTAPISNLWTRPSAEVASRNRRKSGFAWDLKSLGATDEQLNRLVGGDLNGIVSELKQKAQAGDPVSIRVLGQLATVNCRPSRRRFLSASKARQIADAQALVAANRDWFTATVNDDIAFDKQMDLVCDQIDSMQALSSVTALANQGDGGSLWVLSQGLQMKDMQQRFREASAAGFPFAQYTVAMLIDGGDEGAAGTGDAKLTASALLNQSASAVPAAKAELAECEYFGECDGIPVSIDSAIAQAREAAQNGSFSAISKIGPHLPAGQMDPNEVAAWGLVDASAQLQGCGGDLFTVRGMQYVMSTLNATNITAAAREQAESLWSEYGSQIKTSLGCGP